jgi:molybdate transport system substrate-binding protein
MRALLALLVTLTVCVLPARAQTVPSVPALPITVFSAASLRDALTEIAAYYPARVTLSFAGSGTLARQIAAGAPADAVVLAHRDWAAWLEERGLLLADSARDVAGGRLVLIGPAGAAPLTTPPDADRLIAALNGGRLAMGQRDGVPAGLYAREWLTSIAAWDALLPHLAETDSVRAALALVALGAAPLGVVYASDAMAEPQVAVVYEIPPQAHTPIRYPAAALTPAGRDFVTLLASPQAIAIFARHGLTP